MNFLLDDIGNLAARLAERADHIRRVGFVRPDPAVIKAMIAHGPWVEIGAGTGALAAAINAAGGRVVATDNFDWSKNSWDDGPSPECWVGRAGRVIRADAVRAARLVVRTPSIGLMSCWPSYEEDWAFRAASLLQPAQRFAYFGEGAGGCTGDDQFHELLSSDFEEIEVVEYPTWPGIHDYLTIYRRCTK